MQKLVIQGGIMAISTLYLDVYADFLFDETDGKYSDTSFVMCREKNASYKLRTLSACESLAMSFYSPLPAPLQDAEEIPETIKIDKRIKDLETGECDYFISTKYSDVKCEQILCDSFGYRWIIYPTIYSQISENTSL